MKRESTREEWLAKLDGKWTKYDRRGRIIFEDYVYFLRCGDFVKIGRSRDPRKRLAALSASVPYQCELLLVVGGPPSLENQLHRLFRDSRERYEWFALSDEIRRYISNNKQRCVASRFSVPGVDVRTKDGTLKKTSHLQKFKKRQQIQDDSMDDQS